MSTIIDECFDPYNEDAKEFFSNIFKNRGDVSKIEPIFIESKIYDVCQTCHGSKVLTSTHICEGFTVECEDCA